MRATTAIMANQMELGFGKVLSMGTWDFYSDSVGLSCGGK